jgi:dihydroorotate dehydrogenase
MTLSSSSEFEVSKVGNEAAVVKRQGGVLLNEFFSAISPLTGVAEKVVRSFLLSLPPEKAHDLTLRFLPIAAKTRYRAPVDDERLHLRAFGINFKNPIGVAAGVDKDAYRVSTLVQCGFGSVEVGTVTPFYQPGNPQPRAFRLLEDEAIINRFGFNSGGADLVLRRLAARALEPGIVGVNIGANKDSKDRISDYVDLIEKFAPVASYITINISSPNTPGLRNLQKGDALDELLKRVGDARDRAQVKAGPTPVLLKIAPDLTLSELDDVVGVARRRKIDGMIVSNTTLSRPNSINLKTSETGGLSGRPLFNISTRILAETYVRAEGAFPLIGVGGIDSGKTALAKIRAGATLIQLYSALAFRGLDLIGEIKNSLVEGVVCENVTNIADLVGLDAAALTAQPLPTDM